MSSIRFMVVSTLIAGVVCGPLTVSAQQQMTVEELEKYILEQKRALDEVRANRDKTEAKVREVKDALAEQDARRERVEDELENLCKAQEEIQPGSYDDCKSQINS